MSVIQTIKGSVTAIYDEYADSYKRYCESELIEKHQKRILKHLKSMDKILAEKYGEK